MDEFLQIFGNIPLSTAVIFIAAIIFIITLGIKMYKVIIINHDIVQEKENTLNKLQKDIQEIKDNPLVTKEEWKDLKDKQNNLEIILKEILEVQKTIVEKQRIFEEENRLHDLNKLRDRLLQSYRYYTSDEKNPLKAWSEMEQEAFEKLFKDYESLGGDGFMHTAVEPAVAELEIVRIDNHNRMTELMKSRKG